MSTETTTGQRNPLNDFADKWVVDGDCLRCRDCDRGQHISRSPHDFIHRAGCDAAGFVERTPWMTLGALINAQIMRAERNGDAE